MVGDALDLDARRASAPNSAVRTSEERFRSLAEHSSDYMLVYGEHGDDPVPEPGDGPLLAVSSVGDKLHRLGVVHPDDVGRGRRGVRPVAAQPSWHDLRGRSKCGSVMPNGEYRWLEMVATNLIGDGVVDGIVINARDVTERRRVTG